MVYHLILHGQAFTSIVNEFISWGMPAGRWPGFFGGAPYGRARQDQRLLRRVPGWPAPHRWAWWPRLAGWPTDGLLQPLGGQAVLQADQFLGQDAPEDWHGHGVAPNSPACDLVERQLPENDRKTLQIPDPVIQKISVLIKKRVKRNKIHNTNKKMFVKK